MDVIENKPWSVQQVSTEKPNVPRTVNTLTGFVAGSMNGGMNHVVTYKKVMAGERHREYKVRFKMSTLTPITPTYQPVFCTVRAYFVPNSRVWKNAEKYTAQNGGSAEVKIKEIPNLGGKKLWTAYLDDDSENAQVTQTTAWRDSFISSYLPRIGLFQKGGAEITLPKISILPIRGRIAIFNDFERQKEFEEPMYESNSDTVSSVEWDRLNPLSTGYAYDLQMRARRGDSYYTNYRTEIQGFEESYPPTDMSADKALITWSMWEHKIAESRSQAELANENPWSVIAKIRGSKAATQGKVQMIGERTFELNYAAVTQNAYNNAAEDVNFKVLGKQGAYSYTEVEVPLYAGMEFIEEGYIHVIATVSAETVFEKGIDRNLLNVTPFDEYRPDLLNEKHDVLYNIEMGDEASMLIDPYTAQGFKRKYSELFKLPNAVQGDMTTDNYFEIKINESHNGKFDLQTTEIETQKTYQFFEKDKRYIELPNGTRVVKEIWKDYTDIQLNRNQAVMNEVNTFMDSKDRTMIQVGGQNQIFYVGKAICTAELPVDPSIATNYTEWGEH